MAKNKKKQAGDRSSKGSRFRDNGLEFYTINPPKESAKPKPKPTKPSKPSK